MQARQGDILIERVAALPEGGAMATPALHHGVRALVVAYGERSGHAHWLTAEAGNVLLQGAEANATTLGWLRLEHEALLRHDEHAPVQLAPGCYRLVQQRRYDPAREGGAWARAGD